MRRLRLSKGQFSPCTISWNDNENTFEKASLEDTYNCCSLKCDNYKRKCIQYCKNRECINSCDKNTCNENCELLLKIPDYDDIMTCISEKKCTNEECILQCCNANCIHLPDLDCKDYCHLLANKILKKTPYNDNLNKNLKNEFIGNNINKVRTSWLIVTVIIITIIILVLGIAWIIIWNVPRNT